MVQSDVTKGIPLTNKAAMERSGKAWERMFGKNEPCRFCGCLPGYHTLGAEQPHFFLPVEKFEDSTHHVKATGQMLRRVTLEQEFRIVRLFCKMCAKKMKTREFDYEKDEWKQGQVVCYKATSNIGEIVQWRNGVTGSPGLARLKGGSGSGRAAKRRDKKTEKKASRIRAQIAAARKRR